MEGFSLFNSGEYFECHEAFEEVWLEKKGEEKLYYKGLIQIAVALYKVSVYPNFKGATSLLDTGIGYLKSVTPEKVEINIEKLIVESELLNVKLKELGSEKFSDVCEELIPKLTLKE